MGEKGGEAGVEEGREVKRGARSQARQDNGRKLEVVVKCGVSV